MRGGGKEEKEVEENKREGEWEEEEERWRAGRAEAWMSGVEMTDDMDLYRTLWKILGAAQGHHKRGYNAVSQQFNPHHLFRTSGRER